MMTEICREDKRYMKVVSESSIVKNAVKLLSGRRRDETQREKGKDAGEREEE